MVYDPEIINQIELISKTWLNPYNLITSVILAGSTVYGIREYFKNSKKKVEQEKQLKGLANILFGDELK
jgi:hypothetical protein